MSTSRRTSSTSSGRSSNAPRRAFPSPASRRPRDEKGPSVRQKLGAEAFASFFATLVPTSVDVLYYSTHTTDDVSRWLARGFITAVLIYALAGISGAHISPAVSFGFFVRGVMRPGLMVAYWAAQFAGGFAAAGLAYALWGVKIAAGASHPGPGYSQFAALIAEVILTALLMAVILATAEQEATVGKQSALAVGFTVAVCGFFAGPISGASMNPARSIPPQLLGGIGQIAWIYVAGPLLGATLAVCCVWALFGRPKPGERHAAKAG